MHKRKWNDFFFIRAMMISSSSCKTQNKNISFTTIDHSRKSRSSWSLLLLLVRICAIFLFFLKENVHFIASFDQLCMRRTMVICGGGCQGSNWGGRCWRCWRVVALLEIESDRACTEIGLEFGGNINVRRFAGGILHHQEQLGDDLDDVTGLQDEVAFPLDSLRGKTSRYNVGLATELPRGTWLK